MRHPLHVALLVLVAVLCALAQGCGDGASARVEPGGAVTPAPEAGADAAASLGDGGVDAAYPRADQGIAEGAVLPDLAWPGLGEHGEPRTLAMHDYFEPGTARARLLVLRVNGGAWCGPCRWHAAHTGEIRKLAAGARLRWLDLVVGDADNAPARTVDLPAWRALLDAPDGIALGADPTFALRAIGPEAGVLLPLYVFVDTRTMRVRGTLSNPDPATLATRIEGLVAALDGAAAPASHHEALVDGLFTRNEWDMIRDVRVPGAPPADPTNAVADSTAAAALGKALFADTGSSPTHAVSCATCHDPQKQLSDGLPTAMGLAKGSRKTPRIALAAFARWQFWDGRADSLWAQALGPIENPDEIGGTRVALVRRVMSQYAAELAAAFPALALPELTRLPPDGMPGAPAYDALSPADKDAVTRVFVAAGKAIAAYERSFRVKPNALDAYVGGDGQALSSEQKSGLAIFARVGCMQCHWGPRLTDDAFHVTRLPGGRADGTADPGRSEGLSKLFASELTGTGRWSDAPASGRPLPPSATAAARSLIGAFKTPPLRGVAAGAPYGHGGALASLVGVTESYGTGGAAPGAAGASGDLEPWLIRFDVTAQWAIPPFLATLTADPIMP